MHPAKQATATDIRDIPRKITSASAPAADPRGDRYFELFERAPDAYFVTDREGIIREANAAATRLLGVRSRLLVGKRLPDFFDETAQKAYRGLLDRLRGRARSDEWEIAIHPRAGSPVAVSVTIAPVEDSDRKVTSYLWLARDNTRRKQLEDEVLRGNRARSAFLTFLSHEFRTPLQAIFGYTELLEREVHGPLNEAQRRDLDRIQQSQRDLLRLVNATLEFSRRNGTELAAGATAAPLPGAAPAKP